MRLLAAVFIAALCVTLLAGTVALLWVIFNLVAPLVFYALA